MPNLFEVISRDVFVPAPKGVCVMACSFYTESEGLALTSLHWHLTRSDTVDIAFERDSPDNGVTWSVPRPITTREERAPGVLRRHLLPGYCDPLSGRLLMLYLEGFLRNDNPVIDGTRNWYLCYRISSDGGKAFSYNGPVIEDGTEFTPEHPIKGQWVGKNALMIGAISEAPLTLPNGDILIPCHMAPLGPDGQYINPGGGHTYKEALVLRARWRKDGTLIWRSGERVQPDPARTTRGLIEPTIALLPGGRLLMVMRGSNDVKPELSGTKWYCFSEDEGESWSVPQQWSYEDGTVFFSPSSCSQLLAHSSGKLFWIGNISNDNPRGNLPRYPLIIGEVDTATGLLKRNSVTLIDTRANTESEELQLSNFQAREDRLTGEIILHCTRLFANQPQGMPRDWTSPALIYRIAIHN